MSDDKQTEQKTTISYYKAKPKPAQGGGDRDLQAKVDELQGQLDAVTPIPDNALQLMQSVNGVGSATAQKLLDVLKSGQPSDGK